MHQVGLGVAKPVPLLVSQVREGGWKERRKKQPWMTQFYTQDFFAELRLPYSVKRGETFPLNVTVFNYVDVSKRGRLSLADDPNCGYIQVALPMTVTVKNQAEDLEVSQTSHSLCLNAKDNDVISIPTTALKVIDTTNYSQFHFRY